MTEQLVLGAIQGIAEWLPVSSKTLLLLTKIHVFGHKEATFETLISSILLLHMGTFFAAAVYFRKDLWSILKAFFNYRGASQENKKILGFLVLTTLISGGIGFITLSTASRLESHFNLASKFITGLLGLFLLATGFVHIKTRRALKNGLRQAEDINTYDGIVLGLAQGLSTIPGFSRSGMTIAGLLFRKFDDVQSLRLSFLMSLPIVLVGNIVLEIRNFSVTAQDLVGILTSFVFGMVTIHALLAFARRINLGYFTMIFGILVLFAALI
jgi:undecaprenyl-diphosphatase